MKNLITAVLLASFVCFVPMAGAASAASPAGAPAGRSLAPAAVTETLPAPSSDVRAYAAREAANPALSEFRGGDGGLYIGGGAVTVLLLVIIILIIL